MSIKSHLGGKTGSNTTIERSKLGTKRHILTDKNGVPLSDLITSANKHDLKAGTDDIDSVVIKRHPSSYHTKGYNRKINKHHHHLYVLIEHTTPNL
ncbi:MAG: transposase [Candidatus Nitrosocosmicus sp.]